MTTADKKRMLKVMVGNEPDNVIETYLEMAGSKILAVAYPFDQSKTSVPDRYAHLQCEIAAYMINKRGAEGETSHSENGISRGYENADIPDSMMRQITPVCGVIRK